MISFLLVAMEEGLGVGEYAAKAGVSKSVMSRHLLDIGPRMRNQSTGFGLVETRPNWQELRKNEVFLTPKGRALAERLLRFWQSASDAPSVPTNVTAHASVAPSAGYWRES